MTFSILARDRATGRMGVAVASCVLAIGSRACHSLTGKGIAVVQAAGWPEDADQAQATIDAGLSAAEALEGMRRLGRDGAQYAIVAAGHAPTAWTDPACDAWSGHRLARDASVQGNTLVDQRVIDATVERWARADGMALEERLVSALDAGVNAGGDLRGQQSAALLSIGPHPGDETHDLRVDDATRPVAELGRLVRILRAHERLQAAWALAPADLTEACEHIRTARQLAPQDGLVAQCAVVLLTECGHHAEAADALTVARRTAPDLPLRLNNWSKSLPWLSSTAYRRLASAVGAGPAR